jgi:hypothetical protein
MNEPPPAPPVEDVIVVVAEGGRGNDISHKRVPIAGSDISR